MRRCPTRPIVVGCAAGRGTWWSAARSTCRTDADFFAEPAVRPLLLTRAAALAGRALPPGAEAEGWPGAGENLPVAWLLEQLARRGVEHLLVEAGGDLLFQFIAADAIDEMYLTLCPLVVGGDAPSLADGAGFDFAELRRLRLVAAEPVGDEVFLRYRASRRGSEPMTVTIRRATPADAAGFARVMSDPAVYPGLMQLPFNNEHQWRERLAESTGAGKLDLVLVAERDGTIVGNSGLHLNATPHCVRRRHAAAIGIAVAPEAQGQGVGTALMQAMCNYADRWIGLLRLELTVYVDNAPAIALYRNSASRSRARFRGYAMRDGVLVDAFTMARIHPAPPTIEPGPAGAGAPPA